MTRLIASPTLAAWSTARHGHALGIEQRVSYTENFLYR